MASASAGGSRSVGRRIWLNRVTPENYLGTGPARRRLFGVHLLDLGRVLAFDRAPFQLHRRRQLISAGLPLGRQQLESLDLLDPGELGVPPLDRRRNLFEDRRLVRERVERGVLDSL